jgi:ankyrin repeat protein
MTFNVSKLSNIITGLELRKSLDIVNLVDEMGYSVLHSASYYNSHKIAELLISFFRKRLAQYLK